MYSGEIDFRVLVATGVTVHEAKIQIEDRPFYIFEIEFDYGPSDEITTGDVYLIRRCDDVIQSMAAGNVIGDFVRFNHANGDYFSVCKEYGLYDNRIRRPSMVVCPRFQGQETLNSTVLLEVEFEPRSLQAMHAFCLAYFREPCVRAVLLFKYFPQHAANRTLFEAVAVLYRRGPRDEPAVADAVSFGTSPFPPDSLSGTLPDVGRALRVLPAAPLADRWDPALRPFLTVPAEDLHFLGDGAAGRDGAPAADMTLDLWDMLRAGVPRVPARLSRARPPPGREPGLPDAGPPPRLRA
jgi:hypothetical protein